MAGKRDAESDLPSAALVKKSRTNEVTIAGGNKGNAQVCSLPVDSFNHFLGSRWAVVSWHRDL